jgi:glutathione S-transferase
VHYFIGLQVESSSENGKIASNIANQTIQDRCMIILHKFIPAWGLPDISPFCTKVETYLRMTGWQYQTKLGDSRKAPKQKLPFIELQGRTVCDSSDIVRTLEAHKDNPLGHALDVGLSARDLAISRALQSMLEEHLYFINYWRRWGDPAGWQVMQPVLAGMVIQLGVPSFAAKLVTGLIRRQALKSMYAQGTGRYSAEEINAIGIQIITALSDWLGDQAYMLGEQPRTLDATAYSFLIGILLPPIEGSLKAHLQSKANLVAYCQRMKAQYWGEK